MSAKTKRRIAAGLLYGLVGWAIGALVFGFVVLWQQRGAALALGVFAGFALAVFIPWLIVEWSHAGDDRRKR